MSEQQNTAPDLIPTLERDAELCLCDGEESKNANSKTLENLNFFHDEHGCFSDAFRTY